MSYQDENDPARARADEYDASAGTKTSAAAAFALVFGVSALLSALTIVLGPLGLVLGIVGIVLGVLGIRNAGRPNVTGKGVAIGGLVLSIIAVLIGAALAIGVTFFLNDESALNRLEQQIGSELDRLRGMLPEDIDEQIQITEEP